MNATTVTFLWDILYPLLDWSYIYVNCFIPGLTNSTPIPVQTNGTDSKIQLQRKLQEVNINNIKQSDQHKRKLTEQEIMIGKRSKITDSLVTDIENFDVNLNYDGGSVSEAKLDNQNRYSVVVQNNQTNTSQLDPVFLNGGSSGSVASINFDPSHVSVSGGDYPVSYNSDRMDTGQRQSSISVEKETSHNKLDITIHSILFLIN